MRADINACAIVCFLVRIQGHCQLRASFMTGHRVFEPASKKGVVVHISGVQFLF